MWVRGEEMCRCRVSGCEVVLVSSSLGLTVRWCNDSGKTLGAAVVTKDKVGEGAFTMLVVVS